MDESHPFSIPNSAPSLKQKLKNSLCFSCCFPHRHPSPPPPPSSSDENPALIWEPNNLPNLKEKVLMVFNFGSNRHKRNSSTEQFRYDPLSYSLNFEDGFDDEEAPLGGSGTCKEEAQMVALAGSRRGRRRPKKYWGEVIRRDMAWLRFPRTWPLIGRCGDRALWC
ncbi:PREDICTED: uncharacterized protein LOC109210631 isoform X2 [Nicotiana attenuata]|uniref:uncharacterized protein LOC109210631 isoform X2 n=1 Tax=Nicotiana attenuata TaxID=49451 RepID=UPI000904CEF5|nr:PREDICTED: uncharacterized protein LOC109210631 isoform X2 [Nicotiana attenuata]